MIINIYFIKNLTLLSSMLLSVASVDLKDWKLSCCVFLQVQCHKKYTALIYLKLKKLHINLLDPCKI